jgi:chromosome segregation ATPase
VLGEVVEEVTGLLAARTSIEGELAYIAGNMVDINLSVADLGRLVASGTAHLQESVDQLANDISQNMSTTRSSIDRLESSSTGMIDSLNETIEDLQEGMLLFNQRMDNETRLVSQSQVEAEDLKQRINSLESHQLNNLILSVGAISLAILGVVAVLRLGRKWRLVQAKT